MWVTVIQCVLFGLSFNEIGFANHLPILLNDDNDNKCKIYSQVNKHLFKNMFWYLQYSLDSGHFGAHTNLCKENKI